MSDRFSVVIYSVSNGSEPGNIAHYKNLALQINAVNATAEASLLGEGQLQDLGFDVRWVRFSFPLFQGYLGKTHLSQAG